ncbi:HD domain-containing protein [Reichenbachiella sp. MALMAid0571]|uniref:HD domain-containing protein n=1 Tax=Reichenbachiella sp. MALMAid0571 TaxID=3143939 RepID=UPI0032DE6490
MNKNKIINDPVFGFITIPNELIFDIIEHPYFQRLRRIKQLGLTNLVYPGAFHTRFHHALGAMHLMQLTLENLATKGVKISEAEHNASLIAILLHDIGHGPFSHTLEFSLLNGVSHEEISLIILHKLNAVYDGKLDLAIKIFKGEYERMFFHQLVSSQLDIDRIDYLRRDSFFTGVSEGTIGSERIIKMLDVRHDQIVVEEKGIYSIENFLSARRLMYWQVYLHKTSVSAEEMLIQIIKRARHLTQKGVKVIATPALAIFLERNVSKNDFEQNPDIIDVFALLDDSDVWGSMKFWVDHEDFVLSKLSKMLLGRKIFRIEMNNIPQSNEQIDSIKKKIKAQFNLTTEEAEYFVGSGKISNEAYISSGQKINILTKKGEIIDIDTAVELPNIKAMSKIVTKYYLCCPKEVII